MKSVERKVLFVHDGPMYVNEATKQYFGVHYDDKLVNRYKFLGRKVVFLMRTKSISEKDIKRYSPIKSEDFGFIQIPDFKSIRTYFKHKSIAKKIIISAVNEHDLIIVRLPSAAGTIAFNEAVRINKPVLVEFVACVYDALWNYDWRGKLLAHYKLHQYKQLMKKASHTIFVTKEFLQSRYPAGGKAIGCSDVEILPPQDHILENRINRYRKENEVLILGTVAALNVPYKGQADVIKAIGIMKKQGFLLKYKLVGQGSPASLEAAILKYDVAGLVEIIGHLQHNEIFNFLEEIDIYIQPSKVEGLPRAVIEAMSKACPVFGSNIGGIPELIDKNCLFDPGNIDEIIIKLKQINNNWLKLQAEKNFETAKEYQKEILEIRRTSFYTQFLNDWKLNNKSLV